MKNPIEWLKTRRLFRQRHRWLLAAGAVTVLMLQFFNPTHVNPPVVAGSDLMVHDPPPPGIQKLLRGACYDCHSYETRWPWYSRVSPISWRMADDVNNARKRLNFSRWPHSSPRTARFFWNRISDVASSGDMPLRTYKWMHPAARLTPAQRQELAHWADQEAERLEMDALSVK
jgi:hypothetical protein